MPFTRGLDFEREKVIVLVMNLLISSRLYEDTPEGHAKCRVSGGVRGHSWETPNRQRTEDGLYCRWCGAMNVTPELEEEGLVK